MHSNLYCSALALVSLLPVACHERHAALLDDDASAPSCYAFLHDERISDEDAAKARLHLPYDRIAKEERGMLKLGPNVRFYRDGRAYFEDDGVVREGYTSVWEYARLCQLVDDLSLETLKSMYPAEGSDAGETIVTVWRSGAKEPISVIERGGNGPLRLWMLERAIDGVASHVFWKRNDASITPSDRLESPR